MKTRHRLLRGDSARVLRGLPRYSVNLIVTSPPYPMVEMWDDLFCRFDPKIRSLLEKGDGERTHRKMHSILGKTWTSADSRMCSGGMVCVNVGDATRTLDGRFRVYSNHTNVNDAFVRMGYDPLPEILWRKTSNKPNKFMGSGMLPPGAYVTQEHEYILVFRKGGLRRFSSTERVRRRKSAFFWEERNLWFSDVWEDLRGERQQTSGAARPRSAAYPLELAYRLVSMFSVRGDLVVDPFAGTGMTTLASIASGRDSVAVEVDPDFIDLIEARLYDATDISNRYILERLRRHVLFAEQHPGLLYLNEPHGLPVMTRQETSLEVPMVSSVRKVGEGTFEAEYARRLMTREEIVERAVRPG